MIAFWIAAALLAACAGALILSGAARVRAGSLTLDPAVSVYRRALLEIEELAERDLLAPRERSEVRAEAARRLLSAAERTDRPLAPTGRPVGALAAAVLVGVSAQLIYLWVGSPGAPDQPFAARLAAWRATPEKFSPLELAAALRSIAASRPEDTEPLRRLAALDMEMGDLDGASHALRRAIALEPENADLLAGLGEVMVIRAQGEVSAEARALFEHALRNNPKELMARYYLALSQVDSGDTANGLTGWRAVLAELAPGDPRRARLAQSIDQVSRTGRLAPAADTAEVPPAAMTGAISGMVEGLAARLRAHPDDPDGWVRLVRAYAVLGDTPKRDAALTDARRRFAGRRDVMTALDDASKAAPMATAGR